MPSAMATSAINLRILRALRFMVALYAVCMGRASLLRFAIALLLACGPTFRLVGVHSR
jgi:hypothetical protein